MAAVAAAVALVAVVAAAAAAVVVVAAVAAAAAVAGKPAAARLCARTEFGLSQMTRTSGALFKASGRLHLSSLHPHYAEPSLSVSRFDAQNEATTEMPSVLKITASETSAGILYTSMIVIFVPTNASTTARPIFK